MKTVLIYGMTNTPGGIESYILSVIKSLNNKIYFSVVTDFDKVAYEEILKNYNVEIHYIPPKSKSLIKHIRAFYKILKNHREYTTVYFNVMDAICIFTEIVPFVMQRKIITHSHTANALCGKKRRLHMICRPLLNLISSKKAACSNDAAEFMFGSSKDTVIIKNAIDIKKYAYNIHVREKLRAEMNIKNKIALCHVGRICPEKNQEKIIEVFKEFTNSDKNSVLIFVGTGDISIENKLKKRAHELCIDENIIYLGARDDVHEILQAADVFLLPSLFEGIPIAAIEAQAAGLHLVVSDNVSRNVDVTGNVTFIPVDKSKKNTQLWAEAVYNAAMQSRTDTTHAISDKGFDINSSEERDIQLLKIFNS